MGTFDSLMTLHTDGTPPSVLVLHIHPARASRLQSALSQFQSDMTKTQQLHERNSRDPSPLRVLPASPSELAVKSNEGESPTSMDAALASPKPGQSKEVTPPTQVEQNTVATELYPPTESRGKDWEDASRKDAKASAAGRESKDSDPESERSTEPSPAQAAVSRQPASPPPTLVEPSTPPEEGSDRPETKRGDADVPPALPPPPADAQDSSARVLQHQQKQFLQQEKCQDQDAPASPPPSGNRFQDLITGELMDGETPW